MWSLGCIIAELFLGWPLYPGESEYDQVRYICETQGIPHTHLLNSASKAHLYFKLMKNSRGPPKWQLKPLSAAKGGVTQSKGTADSERRKYIFSSLDEIDSVAVHQTDEGFRNEEIAAEAVDRHCMVELLKRTLTIDSHQRINPSSALRHHFITMHHLRAAQEYKYYYEMSRRCLQEALQPTRTSGGDGARPPCLQTESQPQPPHLRGAYPPQRVAATVAVATGKQEHQYHSGSCQAALVGQHRTDNSGTHSQHNLVYSQVRKTVQQLDDLRILDEQDMGTTDTVSLEEVDQAYQTPNEGRSDMDNCPAPNKGTDEEEGSAKYSSGTGQERSFGQSILSYFSSFCGRQQMAKPPQTDGPAPGHCGQQDDVSQDGSMNQTVVYPSQDPMSEQDGDPPQVFLAETQDFLLEDMVTQDFLTQVLTQSATESQDGDVAMPQDMVDEHSMTDPEFRDQAVQAGGEYVLQVRSTTAS